MRRFLPYTALALSLSVLPATAADRYGGWLLEQPRSSVFTLSFKQSVPRNGKIATSELGFICDHRDKWGHVGVLLIPVDGTFENRQRIIAVLVQKRTTNMIPLTFCNIGKMELSISSWNRTMTRTSLHRF
jgi:hypothetical protein